MTIETNVQQNIFIQQIEIKKLLHLEDITIPLSKEHKKHLILTGKNGSGKTKTLEAIRYALATFEQSMTWVNHGNNPLNKLCHAGITLDFSLDKLEDVASQYRNGKFLLVYFGVSRSNQFVDPQGPNKFEPAKTYSISENPSYNSLATGKASAQFLQYLVNLKTHKSFAVSESSKHDNEKFVRDIDNWFTTFERLLQGIFSDDNLKLEFDFKDFKFYIDTRGREKFTLNQMSSGYSAIISIITELIIRMEKNKTNAYDVEGIVLIDEIETHLHVELQKNILPLLITFFPNIQFIVTTHSPFVLQSIANAVIYDLENKITVEDLSAYSWNGIVENYFNIDQYSSIIKQKMQRYEDLKKRQNELQQNEILELWGLENSLISVGDRLSPELATQVKLLIMRYGVANV